MAIEFGVGVPDEIVVEPYNPEIEMEPPGPPDLLVMPVPGPQGPPGVPGGGGLPELADVTGVADAHTGQVLVRGADGIWRPGDMTEPQRGDVITFVATTPSEPPPGARVGEYFIALDQPEFPILQVQEIF